MTPHPQPTHRKPFINTQEQEQLDKPRTGSVFCFSIEFYMTVNKVNLRIWKAVHIQSGRVEIMCGCWADWCNIGTAMVAGGIQLEAHQYKWRKEGKTAPPTLLLQELINIWLQPFMLWAFRLTPYRVHFQDSLLSAIFLVISLFPTKQRQS